MEQTIKQLKKQLDDAQQTNLDEVLAALYAGYMNTNPIDQAQIDHHFQSVEKCTQTLRFHQRDQIFCAMTSLCAEQDRISFYDGVRTGARLILELLEI